MSQLEGKVIVITGATKGIGFALAEQLAQKGAKLAVCGRETDPLSIRLDDLGPLKGGAPYIAAFDIADEEAARKFYARAVERLGPVDVLINNAGFNPRKAKLTEVESAELESILAVNLKSPLYLMQEAYRDMKPRGGGTIVNVLSTVCHADMPMMGAYTAAKQGFRALTAIFRKEVLEDNIRVTAIYPGGTNTTFRPNERPDYMAPESVAEAIVALLALPADLVPHEFTFRPMVETNF